MSDLLRRNSSTKPRIVSGTRTPITPTNPSTTQHPSKEPLHSQVLISRYRIIKHVIKALTAYFDSFAGLEQDHTKSLIKMAKEVDAVQLQTNESADFLPKTEMSSLSNVLNRISEGTRSVADQHALLAKNINAACTEPLKQMRLDIKAHVKGIETDVGKREEGIIEWRQASQNAQAEFAQALAIFKSGAADLTVRSEPFVAQRNVTAVLKRQYLEENELLRATIAWQGRSKTFEEAVVSQLKAIWTSFALYQTGAGKQIDTQWTGLKKAIEAMNPSAEWQALEDSGKLIHTTAPLHDAANVTFTGQDDDSAKPLLEGTLERKRRYTAMYRKEHLALSKAGYLHSFNVKQEEDSVDPVLSLYLPNCMLGPASVPEAKRHTFWIGGRRSVPEKTVTSRMKSLNIGNSEIEYQFRFGTHDEMIKWWTEASKFCKASYTSLADRNGPNDAAKTEPTMERQASVERHGGVFTDEEEGYQTGEEADSSGDLAIGSEAPPTKAEATPVYELNDTSAAFNTAESADSVVTAANDAIRSDTTPEVVKSEKTSKFTEHL